MKSVLNMEVLMEVDSLKKENPCGLEGYSESYENQEHFQT